METFGLHLRQKVGNLFEMAGTQACRTKGAEGKEEASGEIDEGVGGDDRQTVETGEEEVRAKIASQD